MKLGLISNTRSYEIQQFEKACQENNIDFQIFNFNDFSFQLSSSENLVLPRDFLGCDYYVSRLENNIHGAAYIEIRKLLFILHPELTTKFLNGESYFLFPTLNKVMQMGILSSNQVSIPTTSFSLSSTSTNMYPLVMKGIHGSNGEQVHLINDKNEFETTAKLYGAGNYLVQEYLPTREDYRVIVIGNEVAGFMKKVSQGAFVTNIHAGGKATQAEKERQEELGQLALQTAKSFHCEFGGIDIMFDGLNKAKVLEINRAPGFEGFEQVSTVNVAEQIIKYLLQKNNHAS